MFNLTLKSWFYWPLQLLKSSILDSFCTYLNRHSNLFEFLQFEIMWTREQPYIVIKIYKKKNKTLSRLVAWRTLSSRTTLHKHGMKTTNPYLQSHWTPPYRTISNGQRGADLVSLSHNYWAQINNSKTLRGVEIDIKHSKG